VCISAWGIIPVLALRGINSPSAAIAGWLTKKGCCHDETQVIKLDAPAAKSSLVEFGFLKLVPVSTALFIPIHFFRVPNGMVDALHHKPIDAGPPIHVMNCHFRI